MQWNVCSPLNLNRSLCCECFQRPTLIFSCQSLTWELSVVNRAVKWGQAVLERFQIMTYDVKDEPSDK